MRIKENLNLQTCHRPPCTTYIQTMRRTIKTIKTLSVVVVSAFLGAALAWYCFKGGVQEEAGAMSSKKVVRIGKLKKSGSVKKVTEIRLEKGKAVRIVKSEQPRPSLQEEFVDPDDSLTELQKSVLRELQDALDREDFRALRKALSKFTAKVSQGGLGGNVPVALRKSAAAALGWFGKQAAPELVGLMADPDPEVAEIVSSQFELTLQDADMGDAERSEIIKMLMTALTDSEQISTYLFYLNEMRNSRRAETVAFILENGTPQAQKVMREEIGGYLDDGIGTIDDIEKWMAMNPDDECDEETYGGAKE